MPSDFAPDAPLSIAQAASLIGGEEGAHDPSDVAGAPGPTGDDDAHAPEAEGDAGHADEDADTPSVATAPPFWSAEDKAWFAEQPPEVQAKVLGYEKNRDQATSRALREFAEARKGAHAEASQLAALRGGVDKLLGEASTRHASSGWEGIDWVRWARENPAQALQGKIQYEQEQAELQRLSAAKHTADDQAFKAYVAEEGAKLSQVAPDLFRDQAKRQEVGRWLVEQGYPPQVLRGVGALDLTIARKAMQWDRADAALKAPKDQNRNAGQAPGRAVRATAAPAAPSHKRTAQDASNRFSQSRSKDDAIALLNARGNG
jgi:hypothetical protein